MLRLGLALALVSLTTMIVIDWRIGARAEFLNAWSVVERLLGREASAGPSIVASRLGALGEGIVVIAVNILAGFLLAWLTRLLVLAL